MKKIITKYEELDVFIEEFVEGDTHLMLVRGRGGTGKTQRLQKFIDQGKVALISGATITPFDLYCKLFEFQDMPVVIDDIDFLWRDSKCVNLLKLVCQTDGTKRLAWNSARLRNPSEDQSVDDQISDDLLEAMGYEGSDNEFEDHDQASPVKQADPKSKPTTPNKFETTSRVMIIANSWEVRDANLAALMTRGVDICFEPSGEEVHAEAKKFCNDAEVVEFIGEWAPVVKVNFRNYVNAAQLNRRKRLPWKQMLLNEWGVSEALLFVHHLENDPKWRDRPTPEKIAEFARQDFSQGTSKSRYYELRHELAQGRSRSSGFSEIECDSQILANLAQNVESVENCEEGD